MGTITGAQTIVKGSIKNDDFSSAAADVLDADKTQHVYKGFANFAFVIGDTPTTKEVIVHVATKAGTVRGFHFGLNDTGTTTDIDFDLKKNGTTILTGAGNVTHADADKLVKDGTLASASVAEDDILSIAMTVTSSTGAQGPFAWVDVEENAAP